jgi:NADH dehydrogenase [ubiquinone] 1 alpha subcomplex assembly factor 7
VSALRDEIVALIRQEGPIPIARYMELALGHPRLGYYMTREPFGRAGDFTTSPEISQMFGELVGLWMAHAWAAADAPPRVILAEAGPGRGTLMSDALRAARALPSFHEAAEVHLIEMSLRLRDAQATALASSGKTATWHAALDTLPNDAPILLAANEFLDALPIRQYVRQAGHWRERLVGEAGGRLVFGLSPEPEPSLRRPAPDGSVLEISPAALQTASAMARRVAAQGGAVLLIDYGHVESGMGDTFQAVRAHAYADPLETPGDADITAHVDFAAVAAAARKAGAAVHGPVTQGGFLRALGIAERADRLMAGAAPAKAAMIAAQRDRLTDMTPKGIGRLFKVMALTGPDAPHPPGFA